MDLSKRANLQGVREVRGMVLGFPDASFSPTQVVESEWTPLVRADIESEDSEFWRYVGQASIADHAYVVRDAYGEFQETMRAGFLTKTLSEDPAVMHNFMHEPLTTMTTTRGGGLSLAASPHLDVLSMIPKTDVDGQRIMPKVQRGVAGSMSLAFRVTDQTWNEDYTERTITGINLHRGDVASIVTGLAANPAAWGNVRSGVLSAQRVRYLEGVGPDQALLALRAGSASPEQINQLASIVCGAIDMADDAFDAFLAALNIPDPDAAEDAAEQNSALDPEFEKLFVAVTLRDRAA